MPMAHRQHGELAAEIEEGELQAGLAEYRRIDGVEPSDDVLRLRLQLIRDALDRVFGGAPSFQASWTYITATASRSAPDQLPSRSVRSSG